MATPLRDDAPPRAYRLSHQRRPTLGRNRRPLARPSWRRSRASIPGSRTIPGLTSRATCSSSTSPATSVATSPPTCSSSTASPSIVRDNYLVWEEGKGPELRHRADLPLDPPRGPDQEVRDLPRHPPRPGILPVRSQVAVPHPPPPGVSPGRRSLRSDRADCRPDAQRSPQSPPGRLRHRPPPVQPGHRPLAPVARGNGSRSTTGRGRPPAGRGRSTTGRGRSTTGRGRPPVS